MVAVPTAMVVAVRTPASSTGRASGSSMWRRRWRAVRPSAVPASLRPAGTSARPVQVLRMMGSSAYSVSATSAGNVPMRPSSEINTASRASAGTVCSRPVAPSTRARAPACGATHTASGTPTATARPTDKATRLRCCQVRRARSGPHSLAQKPPPAAPGAWPARWSRAMASKGTLFSSARAFMAIIAGSSMLPPRRWMAAQAAGKRCGTSSRYSTTAS